MNIELKDKCDLLVTNKKIVSDVFKWESGIMTLAAATLFTCEELEAEKEKLIECEKMLKKETGIFSDFRGNVKIPLICKMVLSNNAEEYFRKVEKIYNLIKKCKVGGNEHKVMASIAICDHVNECDYEKYVNRTCEIYSRMKKEHPWITSNEDIPFAALLAVSDIDVDKLIIEMENDYKILKSKFHDSNAVQTLSHVLALEEDDAENKCEKVIRIFDELKNRKHKFGTGYELATIGTLAMLDVSERELIELIIEADDYLAEHKGFGNFSLGSKERLLYASQLVIDLYGTKVKGVDGIILSSMLSLTIAIEVCMMICISSCVAANAANN